MQGIGTGGQAISVGLLALVVAAGGPAAAQGPQTRDALLTALAMNECAVTEAETADVFGSQGFDAEFVRHELGEMVLDGTAFLEGGAVLRARAPHCPPADPAPTPAQAFRNEIVANGCELSDEAARDLGIEPERMRPVVESWLDRGAARIEWGWLVLEDCR